MTGLPHMSALHAVTEATWPAASLRRSGDWIIRDGQGGGKRVSAATLAGDAATADIAAAEIAMQKLGQTPLFQIRKGEQVLDARLAEAGYQGIDPVNAYACTIDSLTRDRPPRVTTFDIWEPMAIQLDIWKAGGIGRGRIAVMHRAACPKTALFGRHDNRPAATGFVAVHDGIAMIHALEVLERDRRAGMGRHLTRHAAHWAARYGAGHLAVLCTRANAGANALYASLGMTLVGQYHYRIKEDTAPL
jgi:ribosomal protein S18 acetylase RimI-like enzyme